MLRHLRFGVVVLCVMSTLLVLYMNMSIRLWLVSTFPLLSSKESNRKSSRTHDNDFTFALRSTKVPVIHPNDFVKPSIHRTKAVNVSASRPITDKSSASTKLTPGELKMLMRAKSDGDALPWSVNVSNRNPGEVRHVVFVKVHKAASTTVYNVLIRFGLSRDLNVMLPRRGHILSQTSTAMEPLLYHPPPPFKFDILCNHIIFNYNSLRPLFPGDTQYVAIVRQPWQQFQSAYYYYSQAYHLRYLRGPHNFSHFAHNQEQYEPTDPIGSMTNNRMSVDLGLPSALITNASHINPFLRHLDRVFHLVLLAERMDESLVLLRRRFGWTTKDVLYATLNTNIKRKRTDKVELAAEPDRKLLQRFQAKQMFDIAVYEHFSRVFDKKIADEGEDFWYELKVFKDINQKVSDFCNNRLHSTELVVNASRWNKPFTLLRTECATLKAHEIRLNAWTQRRQLSRLAP